MLLIKPTERVANEPTGFGGVPTLVRCRFRRLEDRGWPIQVVGSVDGVMGLPPTPTPPHRAILALVDRDSVQPGRPRRIPAKLTDTPPSGHKHVLGSLVGRPGIAKPAKAELVDRRPPASHKFGKRSLVAIASPHHQFSVCPGPSASEP